MMKILVIGFFVLFSLTEASEKSEPRQKIHTLLGQLVKPGIQLKEKMLIYLKVADEFQNLKHMNDAIVYYKQAIEILKNSQNIKSYIKTLIKVGSIYEKLKNDKEALDYYKQAYKISSGKQHALVCNALGTIYKNSGKYSLAFEYYQGSTKTITKTFRRVTSNSQDL